MCIYNGRPSQSKGIIGDTRLFFECVRTEASTVCTSFGTPPGRVHCTNHPKGGEIYIIERKNAFLCSECHKWYCGECSTRLDNGMVYCLNHIDIGLDELAFEERSSVKKAVSEIIFSPLKAVQKPFPLLAKPPKSTAVRSGDRRRALPRNSQKRNRNVVARRRR